MTITSRLQPPRFNDIRPIDADEVLYSGSDDDYYDSPTERRRQYEIQKQRFLQGRSLTIISAQLRGPFTKQSGWKNPWLGKSKDINATNHAATDPTAKSSPLNRLNSAVGCVSGSPSKNNAHESNGGGVAVASHKLDSLMRSGSYHRLSSISSNSYGATVNLYMDGAAWNRVQAWRIDVATKAELVEELQATVTPGAKPLAQTISRSKRPASSELLRNALAKKRRFSGRGQSVGYPTSTAGQNHSPTTEHREGSDTIFSTPAIQPLKRRRASSNYLSEAALDSSVAGQTSVSRAGQKTASPAGDFVVENGYSTPTRVAIARAEVVNIPSTPGQPSGIVPRASGSGRSPLRPNSMKINAMINIEGLTQDSGKSHVLQEAIPLDPSVKVNEAQEESAIDFCSQADRSFQYRSKASKANKRHDMIEARQKASQPSFPSEIDLEDSGSKPVEVPNKASKATYHHNALTQQDRSAPLQEASSSSITTDGTNIMIEEAAEATNLGIDGPTLIPTSSAPSQQQAAPSSTSRSSKGVEAEANMRQEASDYKSCAQLEHKSVAMPNTFFDKRIKTLLRGAPIKVGLSQGVLPLQIPEDDARTSKQNSKDSMVAVLPPTSLPQLGSRVDPGGEVNSDEQPSSQDQGTSIKPSTSPECRAFLPSPRHQSPWTKKPIHITCPTPSPQLQLPSQQAHTTEPVRSGVDETTRDCNPVATSVQQSPWTKDNFLPTTGIGAVMPSVLVSNCATEVIQDTEAVELTTIRNPWVSDERPGEKIYSSGSGAPLPTSPQRLRHDSGVASSPISTKQSPLPPKAATMTGDGTTTKQVLPSTPTQQSSLPTPDLTSSLKSFRDFMSPSPEPRRWSRPVQSPKAGNDQVSRRKSALSKSWKGAAKRARLRVSFALPGEDARSSPVSNTDPDGTLEGAELPDREATSPSLVRQATIQAPSRRASSPPLELSQSELPAEGTRFSKFFQTQARKGPQVRRGAKYKPLLPSASQQTCGSPEPDAMAEAFIEADRTRREENDGGAYSREPPEEEEREEEHASYAEPMSAQEEEIDDVTAVLDNLGDFLNSFDVDAELEKARREKQQRERPQEMGLGFPSTQDQLEIMGAGVWD
ncbi:hypothetical protein BR93DRAFT_927382 [Coniochaeta sp. PMI_546]|nr:hypothetical protein BR93DRAFT_927382 [Coniochaeta sp. PMI_546]